MEQQRWDTDSDGRMERRQGVDGRGETRSDDGGDDIRGGGRRAATGVGDGATPQRWAAGR